MGMIPIALAIAGFVLLWIIVNYNSLAAGRASIVSLQSAREQLLRVYTVNTKQLSALLRIYGLDLPQYMVSLANEPGQTIETGRLNTALNQVKQQVSKQPELQDNPDYSDLMRQVEANVSGLIKNQQSLLRAVKVYNTQVARMPYRIVAILFGFKKATVAPV
jgi:hypothetical protein